MRKYEKLQRRKALVTAVTGCTGWGLLGYVIMTTGMGPFWLGWGLMTVAVCVGAYSVDKYMVDSGRNFQ